MLARSRRRILIAFEAEPVQIGGSVITNNLCVGQLNSLTFTKLAWRSNPEAEPCRRSITGRSI
jgi:hypothetical protein